MSGGGAGAGGARGVGGAGGVEGGVVKRGEESWGRLKEDLEMCVRMIKVGEAGWEWRFDMVLGGMMPLKGVGRRLVALALVGELERDGKRRGVGDGLTEAMFDRLAEVESEYENSERERLKREGLETVEEVEEDEMEVEEDKEDKEVKEGVFSSRVRGLEGLFEMLASAVRLFDIISR